MDTWETAASVRVGAFGMSSNFDHIKEYQRTVTKQHFREIYYKTRNENDAT